MLQALKTMPNMKKLNIRNNCCRNQGVDALGAPCHRPTSFSYYCTPLGKTRRLVLLAGSSTNSYHKCGTEQGAQCIRHRGSVDDSPPPPPVTMDDPPPHPPVTMDAVGCALWGGGGKGRGMGVVGCGGVGW